MDEYDGVRLVNCGVIVVWNEEDEETREKRQQLFDDIAATFSRSMDAMDTSFRASVRNEEELRAEVRAAIAEAQERIKKRAQRLRPEPPGDDTPFPIL